jgi:hypothetical protein
VTITADLRHQLIEAVQADQRAGLSKWVEYLGGEDGGYPDWFKHYTWTSVVKLGGYDKDKAEFLKRSQGTTAPYPELNREALAYVYDVLNKSRVHGERVDGGRYGAELQTLLKGGNFGKLYAHAILAVTPDSLELRQDTRGSWTKFNQTDDPRTARRLSGSLQGHGTGWCTAGESTAHTQLRGGDFYVYYTRDEDGKDSVPRIAIRMQQGEVAEVRGVNAHQELEPMMADITAEKLQDLPGGEAYIRKAQDMKHLTAIEKALTANPAAALSESDIRFLYELDHAIEGFGYEDDPRVAEIRALRGERDRPILAKILPEALRDQLQAAYAAYADVAEHLGAGEKRRFRTKSEAPILSASELAQAFAATEKEWQQNGVYDYIVEQLVKHGTRYDLLATPNVLASEEQIVALAEAFGKDQPYKTYVYDDMYRHDRYDTETWSGQRGSAAVRFSLMPSKYDEELGYDTVEAQQRGLQARQAKQPKLNHHVPSLLDAVTYWYALRARGDKLDDSSAFDKTYVRHFNLEPQRLDRWLCVPYSFVNDRGEPSLRSSDADCDHYGRVAVG